jgi:hypothetical protein
MEDTQLRTQSTYSEVPMRRGTDWSAIWGGAFVFAAIWGAFEMLAFAIFGGPGMLANVQTGMGAGMAIWTIVLTIIAMCVAGRETARLAGVTTQQDGLIHEMMMFGLTVVSAVVLTILSGVVLASGSMVTAGARGGILMSVGAEWTAFIALLLGWLAAMGGASTGAKQVVVASRQPVPMRPAA